MITPISRWVISLSNQAFEFSDFWRQCDDIINQHLDQVEIKKDIDERVRIPYAQWVLSVLPYLINYFNLNDFSVKIKIDEPAIVESHNAHLLDANHVVEISLTTDPGPSSHLKPCCFNLLLLAVALI